jgi:gamma-glutamylputrescine oxidase
MAISRRKFLLGTGAGALAAPGVAGLVSSKDQVETGAVRELSLWSSEIAALPSQPRYQGEREVDLAIVGGGYTGLACAYYVKRLRPDWSVVVLDSHEIGSGASSRNSGAVSPKYSGISDPDMPQRGLDRLLNFIESEGIDCDLSPTINLDVLKTKSIAERARSTIKPGENWISPEELRDRTGTSYYAGGAIERAGIYKIHPAKLVNGYAETALRMGVELFENSPVLDIKSGKPATLSTPGGSIRAKHVCLATNAYTPRLGFLGANMFPLHQYTFATRKLTGSEIEGLGLDRWGLRFERITLPVTYRLMPSGHFFVRLVLGYASHNSCHWQDTEGAKQLARRVFEKRYPQIADIGLVHGWHGVTGHTPLFRQIAGPIGDGNIHVSVAYNGSGIVPSHNNGYLTACNIVGQEDQDLRFLTGTAGHVPFPGDFYRSFMLKPFMNLMSPA